MVAMAGNTRFRFAAAQSGKPVAAVIRPVLSAAALASARPSVQGIAMAGGILGCQKKVETFMSNLFSRFVRDESGATAIEYGLIAALIAVVIITGLNSVSSALNTRFTAIATSLR
jgi:pilus assembly protein Flp/PilA